MNIDVDVHKGVVKINGLVEYRDKKKRALEIDRTTEDTVRVVDNIHVRK